MLMDTVSRQATDARIIGNPLAHPGAFASGEQQKLLLKSLKVLWNFFNMNKYGDEVFMTMLHKAVIRIICLHNGVYSVIVNANTR